MHVNCIVIFFWVSRLLLVQGHEFGRLLLKPEFWNIGPNFWASAYQIQLLSPMSPIKRYGKGR
jgi:hypothetical protein